MKTGAKRTRSFTLKKKYSVTTIPKAGHYVTLVCMLEYFILLCHLYISCTSREHEIEERGKDKLLVSSQGLARTQSPTTKNYAPELPTFGVIARVSPTEVQWKGLALRGPP